LERFNFRHIGSWKTSERFVMMYDGTLRSGGWVGMRMVSTRKVTARSQAALLVIGLSRPERSCPQQKAQLWPLSTN